MVLLAAASWIGQVPCFVRADWKVAYVDLAPTALGNATVLRGRETAITAQPFFVLPDFFPTDVLSSALEAAEGMTFGQHNDEADWLPAYEVYVMERSEEVPGSAPRQIHDAVSKLTSMTMPYVREAYNCPTCVACTAFVRRYQLEERVRVPVHFDVTAYATVVLPLSPPENYTGGFFVQTTAHIDSRAFVRLNAGDVAVHDFTLNHGVEVIDGGRFSLVYWVSETRSACDGSSTPWHGERARNGDLVAQHILGMMYEQGNGAPQDSAQALHWTLESAEGGLYNAQFSAGTMFFEGMGTPIDEARAFYWYEKAAAQGDASAQMVVARMFAEGVGVPQDQGMAEYWFRLGSMQHGAQLMGPPRWSR